MRQHGPAESRGTEAARAATSDPTFEPAAAQSAHAPQAPQAPQAQEEALFDVSPGAHDPLADLAAAAGTRIESEMAPTQHPHRPWAAWLWLGLAIVAGATGTTALSQSAGFTQWRPMVVVGLGYLVCFIALTRALHTIPVGIAYAIWSGVGIVLVSAIGWIGFHQSLDVGESVGIGLILVGTVVIQLFSKSVAR
jgi:small multidrug resistance pump